MANTPNIDLVKPAGTDHALVSVLNSNSDKIDTFAGSTNAAITNLNSALANCAYFGSVQSKSISLNQSSATVLVTDFSDLSAPSVSGRTFIGYVGFIDTYRASVLGFGGTRCYYIISAPTNANAEVKVYPMYI